MAARRDLTRQAVRGTFGGDFFPKRHRQRVAKARGESQVVCFTDVRFPEEADLVRESGGVVIRILRGPERTKDQVRARTLDFD